MLTKIDDFAGYICRLGEKLFGEDFEYEKCSYSMQEAYFVKQLFQREEEPAFYKFCVKNVQGKETRIEKVEFELMEGAAGVEFVCQGGSFLQNGDIDKLKDNPKCSFGQRNNCEGIRWVGGEEALSWNQIHFFRTRDKECAEIFLDALSRFKKCGEISFKSAEIERFEARIEGKIRSLFKYECHNSKYYPCFDEKNSFYYTCRAFCFHNINLVLQLRIYPHKQELVCEKPLEFWREWLQLFEDRKISIMYQTKMEQLEWQFIQELAKKDCTCMLLSGNAEPDKGISVGEFKTEDVVVAELFLKELKAYVEKVENYRKIFMKKDEEKCRNKQQKWYV